MKKITFKPFALIAAAAILAGCGSDAESARTEIASPVSVVEVAPGSISKFINTTGTARSAYEVELKSEMAGRYKLMVNPATGKQFKLGDKVNAGQVIARLEDKEYENGIAIDVKTQNLELLKQEKAKQESLYEKGGVVLSVVKDAEMKVTTAQYDYENAMIRLGRMKITAPFGGVIVALPYYTPNALIASGSSIASIMDYSKMFMDINLPESVINQVSTGQVVKITHYTLPNDTIPGSITELSPAISTETRTFKGKVEIDNGSLKLRPGMFVKADIVIENVSGTVIVPKNVVISSRRRKYVFVVDKNTAVIRDVQTGIEDEDNIQIVSGLEFGDNLVIKGQETLRENSQVKIQR